MPSSVRRRHTQPWLNRRRRRQLSERKDRKFSGAGAGAALEQSPPVAPVVLHRQPNQRSSCHRITKMVVTRYCRTVANRSCARDEYYSDEDVKEELLLSLSCHGSSATSTSPLSTAASSFHERPQQVPRQYHNESSYLTNEPCNYSRPAPRHTTNEECLAHPFVTVVNGAKNEKELDDAKQKDDDAMKSLRKDDTDHLNSYHVNDGSGLVCGYEKGCRQHMTTSISTIDCRRRRSSNRQIFSTSVFPGATFCSGAFSFRTWSCWKRLLQLLGLGWLVCCCHWTNLGVVHGFAPPTYSSHASSPCRTENNHGSIVVPATTILGARRQYHHYPTRRTMPKSAAVRPRTATHRYSDNSSNQGNDHRLESSSSLVALDLLQQQLRQQQEQINALLQLLRQPQQPQITTTNHPSPIAQQQFGVVESIHNGVALQQSPLPQPPPAASVVPPLKAMLFIDGTWLYYSIYERPQRDCPLVQKYGRGWQLRYTIDWTKLPSILSRQLVGLVGTTRPIEIVRASVYTSYKADTSPQSYRYKLFESLRAANYDVHMMETVGKSEKCVDIQLAVEVLHYATTEHGSSYDVALLLTGDKDFIPAMIRTRQKGKAVGLVSMKRGCNRALIESPGLRDFDVLWLEDYLDEFVVPMEAAGKVNGAATTDSIASSHISFFTIYKVLYDFCLACDSPRVSSSDAGRYLKYWSIAGTTLLEEIKRHFVGLHQFLSMSGLFVLEHDGNKADKSYWLSLSPEAPELLRREAQQQQHFSPEEREFFRKHYNSTVLATEPDLFYQRTRLQPAAPPQSPGILKPEVRPVDHNIAINNSAANIVDYSQLKVSDLRIICRQHGLIVSGVKASLIERITAHLESQVEQQQQQQDLVDQPDLFSTQTPEDVRSEYLQGLVEEYLHAGGGRANSRHLGRYLAANPSSAPSDIRYPSALAELKSTTRGGLRQFVGQYPSRFGLVDGSDGDHEYEFWVFLVASIATTGTSV